MSCRGLDFIPLNQSSDPALTYEPGEDGLLTLSEDGEAAAPGTTFYLGNEAQPVGPLLYEWRLDEFLPTTAVGLSLDGQPGVYGEGLHNVFYVVNGDIVVNGAVINQAPAVSPGDTVGIAFDPLHSTATFWLNGVRVL